MASTRRSGSIEDHLQLGLPVLFSELLVFKWTPLDGFPSVSEGFRLNFERMQETENLENELRVFFNSFEGAFDALAKFEVRRNTFKFLDQYGTISDILKIDLLRVPLQRRGLVPEYLEERIRNQTKWFRGEDEFSLNFAKEFLRRKFCMMRDSFRAPQPTGLIPPIPPPRRNRPGANSKAPQPSTSQVVSEYTASERCRRNSASTSISPPKPRRMTAEELPSPPPTPPPLRETQEVRIDHETERNAEFTEEESQDEDAQLVPSAPPACPIQAARPEEPDQEIPHGVIDDIVEQIHNNNIITNDELKSNGQEQPGVKSDMKNSVLTGSDTRALQETAM